MSVYVSYKGARVHARLVSGDQFAGRVVEVNEVGIDLLIDNTDDYYVFLPWASILFLDKPPGKK